MMIPLGLGMLVLVNKNTVSPESKFLMLGIAYSANIGGIVTIISSPPNAIGAEILNMNFLTWLKYSVPIFLITFPVMITVLTLYFKPDRKMSIGEMVFEKNTRAPLKTLLAIFLITVVLWMMDGILSPLLHIDSSFNSFVAIFAIFLIFVTKVLTWKGILKSINWEILILPATIAASFGFMMPAGTPPNAMVFSSGYVPQKDMIKAGLIVNILVSIIVTTYFYFVFY